jgi:hypothetical protein
LYLGIADETGCTKHLPLSMSFNGTIFRGEAHALFFPIDSPDDRRLRGELSRML